MAQVEPLPLVPVTWTNFIVRSGCPIWASSSSMRLRPRLLRRQSTVWM